MTLQLARTVLVTGLLSVFGTLVFQCFIVPRSFAAVPAPAAARYQRTLLVMNLVGVVACVAALLAWLLLQAADMADATSLADSVAAVPTVLSATVFGHLIVVQVTVSISLLALLIRFRGRRGQQLGCGLAAVTLAVQSGHSHAAAMYSGPSFLLASDIVHLLAAGAWLGGLAPLLLVVRQMPSRIGALACRWFSPLGQVCLMALAGTAGFQGWILIGSVAGLVGTSYGWVAIAKLALFGILVAFAVANRYSFAPALLNSDPLAAKRILVRSIAVQTGFGLTIIAASVLLSSLAPAMHEQPNWPFPDRFSLDTIHEDPDFRNEVVGAILTLACAGVLLTLASMVKQRVRWLALTVALVLACFAVPHLDLLFVPAYPTSYYRSPTGFAASAIAGGATLFPAHCAGCHGAQGRGDGPASKNLALPPADLTAAHLWMHSDGELFWWLSHGMEAPDGHLVMPGFANLLSPDDRWNLIDFIRAHNAGLTFQATGSWSPPVHAPDLQATCDGGRTVSLNDLRGGFVRLVFGAKSPALDPAVTTILAGPEPASTPRPGLCVADDETVAEAYAIIAGLDQTQIQTAEFLIDSDGWLRAEQHRGAWTDPTALSAQLRDLAAHPIAASADTEPMQMHM
jgi:putative copper export protein/mono/diheme cytochrome c family protein